MSQNETSPIVDRFVDAVRSALESQPDWSDGPFTLLRRSVEGDVETAEFADSSNMSRAAYDLKTGDLRITLRSGELLRIAPIPVEYWDELLSAPSKGIFFAQYIEPRFRVEKLGWFRRVHHQLKSRRHSH
jgi:hypothetical protein